MISIVIPTYEMQGFGVQMLHNLIDSCLNQTYNECEIIVSDDSSDDNIENYCNHKPYINYFRNHGKKGASPNLNNGLRHCTGDIVKPMFMDDVILDFDCLEKFATMKANWAVCTSTHTSERGDHVPWQSKDLYELARGCNSFGSPSGVAWKRNDLTFDETLVWLLDCDFYVKLIMCCGEPEIIDTKVLIMEWDGSATNTIASGSVRVTELEYMENKYSNLKK